MKFKLCDLKVNTDIRGNLVAIEGEKDICFNIKRIFYIYGNNALLPRAGHANQWSEEILICLNGSCRVFVDDGNAHEYILLDKKEQALYVAANVWLEIDRFTEDCIILVLASDYYNPDAQVKYYSEFLELVK